MDITHHLLLGTLFWFYRIIMGKHHLAVLKHKRDHLICSNTCKGYARILGITIYLFV
jgi:hypothetical protein